MSSLSLFPSRPVFGVDGVRAPSGREAAAFDRNAIEQVGVPQPVLMENAGRAAALLAARLHPEGALTVVVGAGNNGGDGWVLARSLLAWGREVRILTVGEAGPPEGLLHGWDVSFHSMAHPDATALLAGASLIVDALLGTGLRGAPRPEQGEAIERMNAAGPPILALDVPSGVDADTGAVEGEAVRAAVTIAFGAPKLGTLFHPGRMHAGRLLSVDIGFPPAGEGLCRREVLTTGWADRVRVRRHPVTHKKAVGSLLIVGGSAGMAGAAILAARAAQAAGCGLIRIASPAANRELLHGSVPEAIVVDREDPAALADAARGSDASLLGPGMGLDEAARTAIERVLEASSAQPLVLDADALTWVARGAVDIRGLAGAGREVALTPHPGELGRLLAVEGALPESERLERAVGLAADWSCVVLAKGTPSLVITPAGNVGVDVQGSSDLATAGMGDVLAGVAGAFAAQGLDLYAACALALHDSGAAHRRAARGPALTPSDVIAHLPPGPHRMERQAPLDQAFICLDLPAAW